MSGLSVWTVEQYARSIATMRMFRKWPRTTNYVRSIGMNARPEPECRPFRSRSMSGLSVVGGGCRGASEASKYVRTIGNFRGNPVDSKVCPVDRYGPLRGSMSRSSVGGRAGEPIREARDLQLCPVNRYGEANRRVCPDYR
jgi:hypothetical protein